MDLGQNFIVGLKGHELTDNERELLAELRPAGIILFKYNFSTEKSWPETLRNLIAECKSIVNRDDFLISIDHEGGKVNRLGPPATHFSEAINWTDSAGQVGAAMGKELAALGFNLNFAPLLDIHSQQCNPVIGNRALSTDASQVAKYAKQFLAAMQAEGVLGCGKHFPGHGDTSTDSHLELPTVSCSADTLDSRELLPFKALIESDLKLIMTAHVLYPALDPKYPATISKQIITGLLREKLGFSGPVVSDALEMKALDRLSIEEKASLSIRAGVDFLLVAQPKDILPLQLASEMKEALEKENISNSILDASHKRIQSLFEAILTPKYRPSGQKVLGCKEHLKLAEALENTGLKA